MNANNAASNSLKTQKSKTVQKVIHQLEEIIHLVRETERNWPDEPGLGVPYSMIAHLAELTDELEIAKRIITYGIDLPDAEQDFGEAITPPNPLDEPKRLAREHARCDPFESIRLGARSAHYIVHEPEGRNVMYGRLWIRRQSIDGKTSIETGLPIEYRELRRRVIGILERWVRHFGASGANGDTKPGLNERLILNGESKFVVLDGKQHFVTMKQMEILRILRNANGDFVNLTDHGIKSRDFKGFPEELDAIIKRQPGGGSRLLT